MTQTVPDANPVFFWNMGIAKNTNMLVSLALGNAHFYPTRNLNFALSPTPTPDANQWNIGGVRSSGVGNVYFMYISCTFHVVCASFSASATRKLADAKADSSGTEP